VKVVAYLRTSTESQEEGLETQKAEIQAWAKREGHRIAGWFTDEGVSGSNGLDSRIGLADALTERSDALVVYKLDRLARDLVVQETILAETKRAGTRVFSTLAAEDAYLADDPKDPTRKLIRQVLGAVADYERAMIRLRMSAGAARKKASGGYSGGGVSFGWRVNRETHNLEKDVREQATLKRMSQLRDDGLSLRQTCDKLDAEGMTPRKGQRWHPYSVQRVLNGAQRGTSEHRIQRSL
jgi:DNA invertase Pin-like site-specific DNA recombinase